MATMPSSSAPRWLPLLFNVSDIAVTLTNIELILGEDDGEEKADGKPERAERDARHERTLANPQRTRAAGRSERKRSSTRRAQRLLGSARPRNVTRCDFRTTFRGQGGSLPQRPWMSRGARLPVAGAGKADDGCRSTPQHVLPTLRNPDWEGTLVLRAVVEVRRSVQLSGRSCVTRWRSMPSTPRADRIRRHVGPDARLDPRQMNRNFIISMYGVGTFRFT